MSVGDIPQVCVSKTSHIIEIPYINASLGTPDVPRPLSRAAMALMKFRHFEPLIRIYRRIQSLLCRLFGVLRSLRAQRITATTT